MKEKLLSALKKRPLWIAAAATIVVVIVLLCLPRTTEHAISVPSPTGTESSADGIRRADVTKDTVQSVLKTLSRTTNYSRVCSVKTFWSGGAGESTVHIWEKAGKTRVSVARSGSVKNILIDGKNFALWYDGSGRVFRSTLADESSTRQLDEYARLVTYEGIFDVASSDILDAAYVEHAGQNCIYAKYRSGNFNYVNQIYVSIDSGLLVSAQIDDGETPVYAMESVSTDLTTPSDEYFTAPT
ncbi:MAG: hypothetical protein ACOX66_01125 [Oscillospiraceae bacterium]